jgi:hypothetical protein
LNFQVFQLMPLFKGLIFVCREVPMIVKGPRKLLLILVVVAFGLVGKPASSIAQSKPNIIFIVADDLNTESMTHLPRLQSLLAAHGTIFSNFFVSLALCCSSRSIRA